MKKYIRLLFLPALLIASSAFAQVTTGQINGTLVDPSGAVVTGATVSATEVETGFTRSTQTNSTGNYGLVALPPGHYNLKTEAKGFATLEQKNIEIIVGQALTLNFTLRNGTSTEVVEVSGEAPLIETSRSDIGGSVSPQEVRDLPVRDRNFASLMALVPGVKPAPNFDPTKSRSGTVSAGGSDGRAFDYNVDGGDNKDTVIGGIVQNYTLEGIQEFNVVTNRYTAESGRAVAGVVNVVTSRAPTNCTGQLLASFNLAPLTQSQNSTARPAPTASCSHPTMWNCPSLFTIAITSADRWADRLLRTSFSSLELTSTSASWRPSIPTPRRWPTWSFCPRHLPPPRSTRHFLISLRRSSSTIDSMSAIAFLRATAASGGTR